MSQLTKHVSQLLAIFVVMLGTTSSDLAYAASDKPFIGLQIQGVPANVAKSLGLKKAEGVLVLDIAFPGPASQTDISRGDIIMELDGKTIADVAAVVKIASSFDPGSQVNAKIYRRGKELDIKINIGVKPGLWDVNRNSFSTIPALGITFAALTDKLHDRFELPWNTRGVVVSLVDEEKTAGLVDLHVGDVIVQVNQAPVWTPEHIAAHLRKAQKENKETVLLLINAKDGYRLALLPVPQ